MGERVGIRNSSDATGTFITVPVEGAPPGLESAFKMEMRTSFNGRSPVGETEWTANWCLIDPGAIDPSALNVTQMIRDCDLLKDLLQKHPKEVLATVAAFQDGRPFDDIMKAIMPAERIGLTEKRFSQSGGGLIGLIIVGAAALLLAGCQSCTSHGNGSKKPTEHP